MVIFVAFVLFFVSISMLMEAFDKNDCDFRLFKMIAGFGIHMILLLVGIVAACCDCDNEKCSFHLTNARKNKRIVMTEQRQKAADVHQKFLDLVKDDPDFKIYFEK